MIERQVRHGYPGRKRLNLDRFEDVRVAVDLEEVAFLQIGCF
jgi:hypothetical protein